MAQILVTEKYRSVFGGKNIVPKRIFGIWCLVNSNFSFWYRYFWVTAQLLDNRFKFLLFPFTAERYFKDIQQVEIRRNTPRDILFSLIPISPLFYKIHFTVKEPKTWIENFKRYGLKMEYVECSEETIYFMGPLNRQEKFYGFVKVVLTLFFLAAFICAALGVLAAVVAIINLLWK